jgi:hypothetical protein
VTANLDLPYSKLMQTSPPILKTPSESIQQSSSLDSPNLARHALRAHLARTTKSKKWALYTPYVDSNQCSWFLLMWRDRESQAKICDVISDVIGDVILYVQAKCFVSVLVLSLISAIITHFVLHWSTDERSSAGSNVPNTIELRLDLTET